MLTLLCIVSYNIKNYYYFMLLFIILLNKFVKGN